MFKNNFPITKIIGFGISSIGVFFLCVLFDSLNRSWRTPGGLREDEWMLLVVGSAIFLCGIGLIAKLKWVRALLIFGLFVFVCFIGYVGLNEFFRINARERPLYFGGGLMTITLFMSFALLFYNEKLNEEFGDTDAIEDWDDVLDL